LDISRSMFFEEDKQSQTLRLFFFCMESALAISASLRIYLLSGEDVQVLSLEQAMDPAYFPETQKGSSDIPALEKIPFRNNAKRIWISDLLFDCPPDGLLSALVAQSGKGVVLAPYIQKEQEPDWAGNMELLDCETGRSRRQRVDAGILSRYRMAYARHFQNWEESSRRYQVRFARIPCEKDLAGGLEADGLPRGVVETWG